MGNINFTKTHIGSQTRIYQWLAITENDSCKPIRAPSAAEKTIQIIGNFGSGNISIEGSI